MGLLGGVAFATTALAPLALLVVRLGVPPLRVTFFLAGAVARHMTHAVPTALLGIPGHTMATPSLQAADALRDPGVPHIALQKMVVGCIIAAPRSSACGRRRCCPSCC